MVTSPWSTGVPWPSVNVDGARYRLRLLNASNARRYDLRLDPPPPEGFVQMAPTVACSPKVIEPCLTVAGTLYATTPGSAWRRDVQATEPRFVSPSPGCPEQGPVAHHT